MAAGTRLGFVDTITNGIQIGIRNAVNLVGAVILWGITFWIPYLNVGTTIGLLGIVSKMGTGRAVSPLEIFDGKYRKQMGEFFLVLIFMQTGILVGVLFAYIPGLVIAHAWLLAPLLVLDRGTNPIEALRESNNLMDGNKWQVFGANFVIVLAVLIPWMIGSVIVGFIGVEILSLLYMLTFPVVYVLLVSVQLGILAYVYASLAGNPEEAAE